MNPTSALIVITGPTGSGKTAAAIELAAEFGGEIVCADSRTVYKGLDIGTAKPTAAEQKRVPHHVLDMVYPSEQYDLAQFQRDANAAIAAIRSRGKVPFLVGGSGLYIDSVVLDYKLGDAPDRARRAELESKSLEELFHYSNQHNITLPNNLHNKRYVIRAIEQGGINNARNNAPDEHTYVFALSTDPDELKSRLQHRATVMVDDGLVQETEVAMKRYGADVAPLNAPAYKAIRSFLNNEFTIEQAIASLAHDDWQLARKQLTWLRRHKWLNWVGVSELDSQVRSILTQASSSPLATEQ